MTDTSTSTSTSTGAADAAILEIVSPENTRRSVPITQLPFAIGRGEVGNQLAIPDRRISRNCAVILAEGEQYILEDRGNQLGLFVNGEKIVKRTLQEGDIVTFGLENSYQIVFHPSAPEITIENLLTRMGRISTSETSPIGLGKLNLLLEATMLLHSQLPLDAVLEAMLDRAVTITSAERGLLLEATPDGSLLHRLARRAGGVTMPTEGFAPTQTALRMAIDSQEGVITGDLQQADLALQGAQSIIAQRLRSIVAIPLYAMPRASTTESVSNIQRGQFLGILYLDSRRSAAFSKLDRQILDALAVEAASILDNARLVDRERQRQRLEQELSIAREIQQALLPRSFRDFPHLTISSFNTPCHAVGGDYFDVFPMSDDRTAFVIADVAGKGIGAALLTTMLQGALTGMTLGADPARVFHHINDFLCRHSDVGRYATMFFGMLDRQGNLDYLNAGHPSPLLLRRGDVSEIFTQGSFPVGLIPEAEYSAVRVMLEPGDTLVLFSDGVTEAADLQEQMYGVPRLSEVLTGEHDAPLDQLQKKVVDSVDNFARGASQADDITLLFIRYRAASQTAESGA
jgi:serine phosphatase RsbU (regulator of sigma subunit)/pSer/pThr/pTyr-binding forkhead associated (FHA) protein